MENIAPLAGGLQAAQTKMPLVTVVTAAYNAGEYLEDCILSIISQTYRHFEYIVIDGNSTDETVNIINKYQNELAYWVSEPDKGIYDAWNKAIHVSKGQWIVFVGADDLLYPNALEEYVRHITTHPKQHELDFVSSRIELVEDDLTSIRTVGAAWKWDLFKTNMITWHVGCFHARHLFERYGVYDSSYKICGDYELLMRPKDKLITSFVAKTTVKMRTGGVSSVSLHRAIDETYRAKIKNGLITPIKGNVLRIVDRIRIFMRSKIKSKSV